jgi:hypothetical protein
MPPSQKQSSIKKVVGMAPFVGELRLSFLKPRGCILDAIAFCGGDTVLEAMPSISSVGGRICA